MIFRELKGVTVTRAMAAEMPCSHILAQVQQP